MTVIDYWNNLVADFKKNKNHTPLAFVLKNSLFVETGPDEITVLCKNLGMKYFLERKRNEFESLLYDKAKKNIRIVINVQNSNKKIGVKKTSEKKPVDNPLFSSSISKEDVVMKSGIQDRFTFDNFAVSNSNQIAHSAAIAVASSPGRAYNPLFIYGGVGCGKTHLTQAIINKVINDNLRTKALYCPSEEFTNDLIESIKSKTTNRFRKKYRDLNVLLIDDIQFVAGKNYIQEEVYHTFNSIIKNGGQIILTSDKHPKEIKKLEDRLRSRFSGGLIIDIQKPDFELRTAILLIKAKERNIDIDIEAAKIVAEQTVDARELEGKLLAVYAKTINKDRLITKSVVIEDVALEIEKTRHRLDPQSILKAIASFYNITLHQLKGESRKENIARSRQIAMFILRKRLNMKFNEIAFILKRKDHTTIMHGVDKIAKITLNDNNLKHEIDKITQLSEI